MILKVQKVNTDANYTRLGLTNKVNPRVSSQKKSLQNATNQDISFGNLNSAVNKVCKTFTESSTVFDDYKSKELLLDQLLGGEFSTMLEELRAGWSHSTFARRIRYNGNGSITFKDDGILPKFLKSAMYPVRDMWLDIGNSLFGSLKKLKKLPSVSNFASRVLDSNPLRTRAEERYLEDIFCTLQGAMTDVNNPNAARHLLSSATKTSTDLQKNLDSLKGSVLSEMLHSTSSVKGNYKTADERTINRLTTGFVSATMAGIDFYNISRMQNDDDGLARKSQNKRFKQESSRICMSAAMTFLTLGALSKYVNKNKYVALATISGTTLISEILSRLLSGMPLRPLTPDEAKTYAHKQHGFKLGKNKAKQEKSVSVDDRQMTSVLENKPEVFSVFNPDKLNDEAKAQPETKEVKFKGEAKKDDENSLLNLNNILKAAGVLTLAGLSVCFARSRSEKFNSMLKDARRGLDDAMDMLTKKDFEVPLENVNKMLDRIDTKYGLHEYAGKFREALATDSYKTVKKVVNGKEVEYVVLGKVDKKIIAPVVKAITYPFNFVWGAIRFPIKMLRGVFEGEITKDTSKVKQEDIIGLYKVFDKALKEVKEGKMTVREFDKFIKRKTIIGALDKTGKSTYKNSSLAAISRPFVTLIASYFFVNDYRNEVLITSEGRDVEGANAVAKERIMHKVSNFFFNSMFMNLFNSVFEGPYHSSLIGAGLVAGATEFTNENAIRKSIGVPTRKMTKEQIEKHDQENLTRDDFWGKYFRFMSKLTGKKSISQKAQDSQKKAQPKPQEAEEKPKETQK